MDPGTDDPFLEPSTESAPAAETPRLGILHLMVLTACVAFYQGSTQGLERAFRFDAPQINQDVSAALSGVAAGAAMAGLILFVNRRRRRMSFPVHPGEFLIVMQGGIAVMTLLWLTASVASVFLLQGGIIPSPGGYAVLADWVFWGGVSGTCLVYVALWIWVLVGVTTLHWRVFLLSIPVCYILALVSDVWTLQAAFLFPFQGPVLISLVLVIVVLRDHLQGLRYPWTHWFGVTVYFWHAAAGVISNVAM